jgi:peptidoglycan-N-acetylglucosamine deacetylase
LKIFRTPTLLQLIFSGITWRLGSSSKVVYLTFDDGPMPGPTDFVLEQLAHHQAKATFFCIGDNIRKHPSTFEKILKENHQTSNHTFHHLNAWKTSAKEYVNDINRCQDLLPIGSGKNLFRPPFGKLNPFHFFALSNMHIVMWDLLSYDFDSKSDPAKSLEKLKRLTRNGSIIVFHDSLKAEKNLRVILPAYLQFLTDSGYQMKKISQDCN